MIDLHMHCRYSDDGEYTPSELVEKCERAGVRLMSVTDHNCAKANEEAQRAAEERGIRYIPGIEIDCTYENINFHVLGYGIDYRDSGFEAVEKNVADQSAQASLERLEKTQALGFSRITEGDMLALSENSSPTSASPGYPNTPEKQDSDLKSHLMMMIEDFKNDINKFLKEIQENKS